MVIAWCAMTNGVPETRFDMSLGDLANYDLGARLVDRGPLLPLEARTIRDR